MQEDMKKLIAYSSVAHMGFVTLGLASVFMLLDSPTAAQMSLGGAYVQMISHGFINTLYNSDVQHQSMESIDTVTDLLGDAQLLSGKRAGWQLLLLSQNSLMHLEFERHVCKDRS